MGIRYGMQETTKNHLVIIERQKSISVNGVASVLAFSETKITLSLVGGTKMFVAGSALKISGFSEANGTFNAVGEISGISYGGKGFASKLFR